MSIKPIHQPKTFTEDTKNKLASNPIGGTKIEDSQLWSEFQSGNEAAYASIYRNNVFVLYNYGLKIVNDKNLVKDCIQDLFVELWDSKHRLGKVKSIKSYLFKSLRRKLISESVLGRKTVHGAKFFMTANTASHSLEHSLIEKQEFDQQQVKLKEAINKLTDRQKEIIYLKYYAFLSYIEIAEIMSLSKKGTYKLMGRTIGFLRKYMGAAPLFTIPLLLP
ncbi:RNA polymerase sigma factor [Flagellimonas myxillae]|uniref:RNA polymerase sigma factor n=1 Tax=Flagellimonas myxillae TaxID=2942214 RepID=UPI00201EF769|nr:sigma-70 family RNA polymerase sigma factor [Muricauda myxillae]MCL6265168.1 sigma-70 family RNA polymerase sigma factor [Muricauda myxillae]